MVLLTPHLPSSLSLPYLYCFLLLLVLKEMVVLVTGLSPGERLLEVFSRSHCPVPGAWCPA